MNTTSSINTQSFQPYSHKAQNINKTPKWVKMTEELFDQSLQRAPSIDLYHIMPEANEPSSKCSAALKVLNCLAMFCFNHCLSICHKKPLVDEEQPNINYFLPYQYADQQNQKYLNPSPTLLRIEEKETEKNLSPRAPRSSPRFRAELFTFSEAHIELSRRGVPEGEKFKYRVSNEWAPLILPLVVSESPPQSEE